MYQYGEHAAKTLEQLSGKGVFFTVKNGERVNTMTIGWGSLSQYWGQEVFIAPIRESRYSFELLKGTDEFTVSVPLGGTMDEALRICGSKSGRDGDKFALAGLQQQEGRVLSTPVVAGCGIYYECKILYTVDLEQDKLPQEIAQRWYPQGNLHRLLFGKIVACYGK